MIIVIARRSDGSGVVRLTDANTFSELAAESVGLNHEQVVSIVGQTGVGLVGDGHVWIDIDFLRHFRNGTREWDHQFDAMIAYATERGWVDADGTRVRAHLR